MSEKELGAASPGLLDAIRRKWWIFVAALILFTGAGVAAGLLRSARYTATARYSVDVSSGSADALANITQAAVALASTYSRAATAAAVVQPVAARTGLDPATVADSITATPVPQSPVIVLAATARSGSLAVRLARLMGSSLTRYVASRSASSSQQLLAEFRDATRQYLTAQAHERALTRIGASSASLTDARIVTQAAALRLETVRTNYQLDQQAAQPTLRLLNAAARFGSDRRSKLEILTSAGLVAGIAIGSLLAYLLASRPRRGPEPSRRPWPNLGEQLRLPVLDRMPLIGDARDTRSGVGLATPGSPEAQAYDRLRLKLLAANADRGAQTILFTSAVRGEGRTTIVANLGAACARAGDDVILVDLHGNREGQSRLFDSHGWTGITDVVLGHASVHDALAWVPDRAAAPLSGEPAIGLLPIGTRAKGWQELLARPDELVAALDELRRHAELILIDGPPLAESGDAAALARWIDAVVVVGREDLVPARVLPEMRRLLDALPAVVLGLVAVGGGAIEVPPSSPDSFVLPHARA